MGWVAATRARPSPQKQVAHLIDEWDSVAALRARHIADGSDVSYHAVLAPAVRELAEQCALSHVVDFGCGSGFLTAELASRAEGAIGLDFSAAAVDYARNAYDIRNLSFEEQQVEDYRGHTRATLVLANMSLMTMRDLNAVLAAVTRNLAEGGAFIFTIPHPRFWPLHCGYQREPWFTPHRALGIEWHYSASFMRGPGPAVTHYHRPWPIVRAALAAWNLEPEIVLEPFPSAAIAAQHGKRWRFPHFLAARCRLRTAS